MRPLDSRRLITPVRGEKRRSVVRVRERGAIVDLISTYCSLETIILRRTKARQTKGKSNRSKLNLPAQGHLCDSRLHGLVYLSVNLAIFLQAALQGHSSLHEVSGATSGSDLSACGLVLSS